VSAPIEPGEVGKRLAVVRSRIRAAGGDPERTRICAVTKGFGVDAVVAAGAVGLVDIGENYAQEITAKQDELAKADWLSARPPRWHMIGRLQRNKVRTLAGRIDLWQSVDRIELADEIARRAPGAAILVQVNATGEEGKGGFSPAEVPAAVEHATAVGLDVRGLMAVGPTDATADPRPGFEVVAGLAGGLGLPEVSMGMSGDLEAAVSAGSTMIRVGTALFGPRPRGVTAEAGSDR
jgi:PLP dependent protein